MMIDRKQNSSQRYVSILERHASDKKCVVDRHDTGKPSSGPFY